MEHYRFNYFRIFLLCFCLFVVGVTRSVAIGPETDRRILHQPLFPVSSPPPDDELPPPPPPPPPPDSSHPFFPEVPSDPNGTPPPPVRSTNNGSIPIPASTQPGKPAKNVAIAISVGVVTLGMLSGLAFFLYRHRTKHPGESQKLVGATRRRLEDDPRVPPSNFLYIGTVEPSSRRSVSEENGPVESPYHKLNSVRISDRYRPSPELQPLPPLSKEPITNPLSTMSSSDEESHESAFYTPQGSSVSNEENCFSVSGQNYAAGKICSGSSSIPHSKRTSPRSRLSASSPDSKLSTMKPLMRQTQTPPPPPGTGFKVQDNQRSVFLGPSKPRFSAPPPPPNMTRLQSIGDSSLLTTSTPTPPPPPPPPPSLKLGAVETSKTSASSHTSLKQDSHGYNSKFTPLSEASKSIENTSGRDYSVEPADLDELEGGRPKLKPLHWDKVRATSDRATVWDRLKSSSFKLNEDMMESLFGCNSANMVSKEGNRRSVRPPVDQENRVLDPKKSQNIAILLRALNVTKEEVSEALLDGNPEALGAELFETLVKMAPTREEEIKLCNYNGDISKLGSAERFLKKVLDIPSAFKRVEAMLYRANFDAEVAYLRKCFQTLEDASEELKNSRLFLKLLEAVLQTGNRMNVGTNRGDARAFKLDTLLKLVDVKGTDGKTTLLHFVVQEIIRSEGGASPNPTNENAQKQKDNSKFEEDFKKQGLQVVSGLGRDLNNVKSAAGMDSDVLHGYVSKLETGLEKARSVLKYEQPSIQGKFFESMKLFLRDAEEDMNMIKGEERRALSMVKEVTEYFHGNAAKEEAHPFRIFMIVRDFLSVLDHVCKEVRSMQDKTMVGSARSFRISANSSLPVLNRYNATRNSSSDDYSLSP